MLVNSLADICVTQKSRGSSKIEKIHDLVNWNRFGYRLCKIQGRSGLGRPSYDSVQMFKVLALQNLYGLSDPDMEEMLYDRLSFRRFCGFSLSDKIPDETTICRFRGSLAGHTEKLFHLVLEDIKGQGIQLQSGAILDASIVRSSVRPPSGGDVSTKDPEAGWIKKQGEYHCRL